MRSGWRPEEDDLLGAEALRGDHAAQADRAVADDGDGLAGADPGADGRVVARPHHVRQREQRRHQRVVLADRQDEERAVRLGHAHRFALAPSTSPEPKNPPWRQELCSPSRQKTQVPSE